LIHTNVLQTRSAQFIVNDATAYSGDVHVWLEAMSSEYWYRRQ